MVPGLVRSLGEETGYPLWYSWTCLVAQMVKNPPAMQETWVRSLGWEDPLEEGLATHSNVGLPWCSDSKESACIVGDLGSIPWPQDPLEEGMATHSSILAWRIPWTEEPGRLQSMRSQRVGHN